MRRIALIISVLVLSGGFILKGQDPVFTQFYAAPIYLSPSFAGGNGQSRIILNFRDQWPKLPGDYITFAISADHYLQKYNSGVGLLLLRDETAGGLFTLTNVGLNYNYNFNLSRKWKLSPGLQVYYYMRDINFNKLIFSDQISREYTTPVSIELDQLMSIKPVRHLDVTSSLLAYNDKIWAGFTLDHMLSMNSNLKAEGGYLPMRFSFYGGGKYRLPGKRRSQTEESISGAFNLMLQDTYKYLDLGCYYTRTPMMFGLWYRGIPVFPDNPNNGAIALLFGYKFSNVTVSYSYDYTLSRLMTKTGGAHEISLAFGLQNTMERRKKHRMIPCPSL